MSQSPGTIQINCTNACAICIICNSRPPRGAFAAGSASHPQLIMSFTEISCSAAPAGRGMCLASCRKSDEAGSLGVQLHMAAAFCGSVPLLDLRDVPPHEQNANSQITVNRHSQCQSNFFGVTLGWMASNLGGVCRRSRRIAQLRPALPRTAGHV